METGPGKAITRQGGNNYQQQCFGDSYNKTVHKSCMNPDISNFLAKNIYIILKSVSIKRLFNSGNEGDNPNNN